AARHGVGRHRRRDAEDPGLVSREPRRGRVSRGSDADGAAALGSLADSRIRAGAWHGSLAVELGTGARHWSLAPGPGTGAWHWSVDLAAGPGGWHRRLVLEVGTGA